MSYFYQIFNYFRIDISEPRFVGLKPSLVAAAAIYTALKGIRRNSEEMACRLAEMASVKLEQLFSMSASIDNVISTEMAAIEQQSIDLPMVKSSSAADIAGSSSSSTSSATSSKQLSCSHSAYGQNTPTDVQDIVV